MMTIKRNSCKTVDYSPKGSIDKLKIATINISNRDLANIDILVNLGFYASRSECCRDALKQFLHKEVVLDDNFRNFEDIKRKQMEKMIQ